MIKNGYECHLEYTSVKDNLIIKCKRSCCNKNYQKILMKSKARYLVIHKNFLTMILINLFYCCKKAVSPHK